MYVNIRINLNFPVIGYERKCVILHSGLHSTPEDRIGQFYYRRKKDKLHFNFTVCRAHTDNGTVSMGSMSFDITGKQLLVKPQKVEFFKRHTLLASFFLVNKKTQGYVHKLDVFSP